MAAQGRNWHILHAFRGPPQAVGGGSTVEGHSPGAGSISIPPGTSAIVVLSTLQSLGMAKDVVSKLRRRSRAEHPEQPPILAVLLGDISRTERVEDFAKAQHFLDSCGVDDVVVKVGGPLEVAMAIVMGVARVRLRDAHDAKLRKQVQLECQEEAMQMQPEGKSKDDGQESNPLFWRCVERVLPGFPVMLEDVTDDAAVGAMLGPSHLDAALGKGRFGRVFSATNMETGEVEAVKVLDKSSMTSLSLVKCAWKELGILNSLSHENVVAIHGAVHGLRHVAIRMELVGQNNLFRALKLVGGRFAIAGTKRVLSQIAAAVSHCHSRGVAHRDIKAENIGITDDGWQVKLLDFGLASDTEKLCTDCVGTMPFTAPEVLAASSRQPFDPMPADVWAMGTLLFEIIRGIGRLHQLLGWTGTRTPERVRRQELSDLLLNHPQAFTRDLELYLNESDREQSESRRSEGRKSCGSTGTGGSSSYDENNKDDLMALCRGMLEVHTRRRWTARRVGRSSWLPKSSSRRAAAQFTSRDGESEKDS